MSEAIRIQDNLDLAYHSQLGLHGLIETCDPDVYCSADRVFMRESAQQAFVNNQLIVCKSFGFILSPTCWIWYLK